jgi:hypothetical protein
MANLGAIGFNVSNGLHDVHSVSNAFGTVSIIGIDNLVRVEPAQYSLNGTVKELGLPVQRLIRMYRRDNGALMCSITSNADGTFTLPSNAYNGEHYVIALDDDAGVDYEPLVFGRLIPS